MLSYLLFEIPVTPIGFFGLLFLAQLAALVLDQYLGEPRKLHPLVGYGNLLSQIEKRLNPGSASLSARGSRFNGVLAWLIATLPLSLACIVICGLLLRLPGLPLLYFWLFNLLVLYLAIGLKSLAQHADYVAKPLGEGDIEEARAKIGWIVSRNTETMSELEINKACLESVLENGNDAVFGALFWFVVAGAPGVFLYRLVNTLDASWGYRNDRFLHFGWCSARADDLMNFIPARICSVAYSLCGDWNRAIQSWKEINQWRHTQGRGFASPNAGPVMASGAGALQLQLGGAASYDGILQRKPPLGSGREPHFSDISLGMGLVYRALSAFMIFQALSLFLMAMWGLL